MKWKEDKCLFKAAAPLEMAVWFVMDRKQQLLISAYDFLLD